MMNKEAPNKAIPNDEAARNGAERPFIELSPAQRRSLRAQAHPLRPVVSISQRGLTESVVREIDRCLAAHELIKVRVYDCERPGRDQLLAELAGKLACAPVQHIGNILVLWRPKPEDNDAKPAGKARSRRKAAGYITKKQAALASSRRRQTRGAAR